MTTKEGPRPSFQSDRVIRVDALSARVSVPDRDGLSIIAFFDRGQIGNFLNSLLPLTSFDGLTKASHPSDRIELVATHLTNESFPLSAWETVIFGPKCRLTEDGKLEFDQATLDEAFLFLLPKGSFFGLEQYLPVHIDGIRADQRRRAISLLEKLGLLDESNLEGLERAVTGKVRKPMVQAALALIKNLQRWQRGASMQAW